MPLSFSYQRKPDSHRRSYMLTGMKPGTLQPPLSPPLVEPMLIVVMCFFVFEVDILTTSPYHRY